MDTDIPSIPGARYCRRQLADVARRDNRVNSRGVELQWMSLTTMLAGSCSTSVSAGDPMRSGYGRVDQVS